jgi:hypothetical protein
LETRLSLTKTHAEAEAVLLREIFPVIVHCSLSYIILYIYIYYIYIIYNIYITILPPINHPYIISHDITLYVLLYHQYSTNKWPLYHHWISLNPIKASTVLHNKHRQVFPAEGNTGG